MRYCEIVLMQYNYVSRLNELILVRYDHEPMLILNFSSILMLYDSIMYLYRVKNY